ncbi:hypothetical protein BDN71DRAFT_703774 [Pleurotus eryngii]|uniref:Uncharacterized protein n=1 Tax=Pleurotus eryngii TaxID=5323 RepID=A0A9P6DE12_PLEER|nr:hypothetical protein BDN71DRAFT_703774 [Pleurotus eryngii]
MPSRPMKINLGKRPALMLGCPFGVQAGKTHIPCRIPIPPEDAMILCASSTHPSASGCRTWWGGEWVRRCRRVVYKHRIRYRLTSCTAIALYVENLTQARSSSLAQVSGRATIF